MVEGPWTPDGAGADPRRHAPAAARNRDAIIDVLAGVLPPSGLVLEVASGSGEHIVDFARHFPGLEWQPSDPDAAALASIIGWSGDAALPNLLPPMQIDAAAADWPIERADAILCINMIHISEWAATVGLFKGGSEVLQAGAPLILYGPYVEDAVETAASNLAFDRSLKARNSAWGLRNLADVDRIAVDFGFERTRRVEMPTNNLMLIYRKA